GETLKPYLLYRTGGVPAAPAIASIGIKKCLLALAEAVYLGTALALGWAVLARHSEALIGRGGLPLLVVGAVVVVLAVAGVLAFALTGGSAGGVLHRALMRIPIRPLRGWLGERRASFEATDDAFRELGAAPRGRLAAAFAMLLGAWFCEAAETVILL